MRITFSIPTYNRLDYIERMSSSLLASVDIDKLNVRIYDDCSPDLTTEQLASYFPYATEIVRRETNLKADKNIKQIFIDFLSTGDDILFLGDSDLVYRSGWLEVLKRVLPLTDGILSLYDSRLHPFIDEGGTEEFAPKTHLGAAGTAFHRTRVMEIVEADLPDKYYDWTWSQFLVNRGYRLMCLRNSYIQHIGILGQNNNGAIHTFDLSLSFVPDNLLTQKIIAKFYSELITENELFLKRIGAIEIINLRKYDVNFLSKGYTLQNILNSDIRILHYFKIKFRVLLFEFTRKLFIWLK